MERIVISLPEAGTPRNVVGAIGEAAYNPVASGESILHGDPCVGEGLEPVAHEFDQARPTWAHSPVNSRVTWYSTNSRNPRLKP